MSLLRLESVEKEFQLGETKVRALRGVDLKIEEGEYTVITGPSGSGKSTILNLIGLLESPTKGEVYLDEKKAGTLPEFDRTLLRRNFIGFIFQNFNLLPILNVYENIEISFVLRDIEESKKKARILEMAKAVGLTEFLEHKPDELSGGQRQRVAVARALAPLPRVILADEPTANLDSKTSIEVLELMKTLSKEHKMTFLFSSHDQDVIRLAERTITLHDGLVVG